MAKVLEAHELVWLAEQIKSDIDLYCKSLYNDGHRSHLGASLIGHECSRYLWYVFRWIRSEDFSGRMLRLFNRGHKEEFRFVEWLRGIGFSIYEYNPDEPDKQFRVAGIGKHFGGSLDGLGSFPERYYIMLAKLKELGNFLFEFKTSNTKGFEELKKKKVALAKPQHYTQMCTYGYTYNIKYALYMCINKETDEIYYEIIQLSPHEGYYAATKAEAVINSSAPPPRLSENPIFFKCKFCHLNDLCHYGEGRIDKNCRSCANLQPIDNGQWFCHKFEQVVPEDFIPKGCNSWVSIA